MKKIISFHHFLTKKDKIEISFVSSRLDRAHNFRFKISANSNNESNGIDMTFR